MRYKNILTHFLAKKKIALQITEYILNAWKQTKNLLNFLNFPIEMQKRNACLRIIPLYKFYLSDFQ